MHRIVLAAVLLLIAGCSTGPDRGADVSNPPGSSGSDAARGEFPVTVPHTFGETTVASQPQRVVSVGLTEQDTLLQLGVVPEGTTEWYRDQPGAVWPWAQERLEELGGDQPQVLDASDGVPFEEVANLRPDLIVATNAGLTQKDYDLLSQIAPTIAQSAGGTRYFSPWRDQALQIARGLGREADGQALVDEVDEAYAAAAAAHPDWAGRTATFSQGGPSDGQLYVYPAGLSTDFLTDLGFTITPGLDDYASEIGSQALISAENVDLIDADVIVFATEDQDMFDQLQSFGTVGQLAAVAEDRTVYTDATTAGAIYFDTPLAHLYLIEHLVPQLAEAVEGTAPRAFPSEG